MARPLPRGPRSPSRSLIALCLLLIPIGPGTALADSEETQAPAVVTPAEEVPRLATATSSAVAPRSAPSDAIAEAKRLIAACREKYGEVKDYTCTFFKNERVDGKLTGQHVMRMKARTRPASVYFKFVKPNAGREAIFVAGRNKGRAMVHDVGLGRLLAGTVALDPRSSRAMEDCRHPITEAGLGHLIETIETAWAKELRSGESRVSVRKDSRVGDRPCTIIEATHPQKHPSYLFHTVKVYIDQELGLPIRFEAYDWPRRPGASAELVEEYSYANLRLNPGLRDSDFDTSNPEYSFGRF